MWSIMGAHSCKQPVLVTKALSNLRGGCLQEFQLYMKIKRINKQTTKTTKKKEEKNEVSQESNSVHPAWGVFFFFFFFWGGGGGGVV